MRNQNPRPDPNAPDQVFDTATLRQFVIVREGDSFVLKVVRCADRLSLSRVAEHRNIDAIRVAIPRTHVKSDAPVEAPIVEVWIDKRVADPLGGDRFVHV